MSDASDMIARSARRQTIYPTRPSFVARFGEVEAARVEAAAAEHANGVNSERKGSDEFRWAIVIAIGYDCLEKPAFREYHGIVAPWEALSEWIKTDGELAHHDGDSDYLALFAGKYNEFVGVADAR